MPVHSVGKDAYQWGKTGKVYKGKDAKKKAIKQAIAIAYSEAERSGKKKPTQEDIEATIKGEEITKEANMNYPIRNTMSYLQKVAEDKASPSMRHYTEQAVTKAGELAAKLPAARVGAMAGGAAVGGLAGAGSAYLIAKYLLKKKLSTAALIGAGIAGAGVGGAAGYGLHRRFGSPATFDEYLANRDAGRYDTEDPVVGSKREAADAAGLAARVAETASAADAAGKDTEGQGNYLRFLNAIANTVTKNGEYYNSNLSGN